MDLQHALGCMKGSLVTRRHNEVCDEIADLRQMAYGPSAVRIEPTVYVRAQLPQEGFAQIFR